MIERDFYDFVMINFFFFSANNFIDFSESIWMYLKNYVFKKINTNWKIEVVIRIL